MTRSGTFCSLSLVSLLAAQAVAALPDWTLSLEERVLGDGNVLRLSDADEKRLEDDPSFQTDVEGPAALKFEHRASLGVDLRLTGRKGLPGRLQRAVGGKPGQGRLRLNWEGKWTQVEGSSAMGNHSQRVGLGWQPRTGWGMDAAWRHLENFDLRQFSDRDTDSEHGASFDSDQFTLTLKARGKDVGPWLRQPGLGLSGGLATEYYNPWFTEYDAESRQLGLEFTWRMPHGLDAGLAWSLVKSDNVGFAGSQPGQVNLGADSESGDATNEKISSLSLSAGRAGKRVSASPPMDRCPCAIATTKVAWVRCWTPTTPDATTSAGRSACAGGWIWWQGGRWCPCSNASGATARRIGVGSRG